MKILPIALGLALMVAAVSVSCDKLRTPLPALQPAPVAPGPSTSQDDERSIFTQEAQKDIDDLRVAIASLRAKAEAAGRDIRSKLVEEATQLEADRQDAQQQLGKLKDASVDSWRHLKEAVRGSVDRLKGAVERARRD